MLSVCWADRPRESAPSVCEMQGPSNTRTCCFIERSKGWRSVINTVSFGDRLSLSLHCCVHSLAVHMESTGISVHELCAKVVESLGFMCVCFHLRWQDCAIWRIGNASLWSFLTRFYCLLEWIDRQIGGYHSIFYLGNVRREIYSLKNFNYRDWEFNLLLEWLPSKHMVLSSKRQIDNRWIV